MKNKPDSAFDLHPGIKNVDEQIELEIEMELVKREHSKSLFGTVPLGPKSVFIRALTNLRQKIEGKK